MFWGYMFVEDILFHSGRWTLIDLNWPEGKKNRNGNTKRKNMQPAVVFPNLPADEMQGRVFTFLLVPSALILWALIILYRVDFPRISVYEEETRPHVFYDQRCWSWNPVILGWSFVLVLDKMSLFLSSWICMNEGHFSLKPLWNSIYDTS